MLHAKTLDFLQCKIQSLHFDACVVSLCFMHGFIVSFVALFVCLLGCLLFYVLHAHDGFSLKPWTMNGPYRCDMMR